MYKYLYFFIGLIFVVINVNFIVGVTFGIPLADEWRWIKDLLIPLLNDEIDWKKYLIGEYAFLSHSHYAALSFLWLDYHIFDLDLKYFAYFGIVFYVLGYLLLLGCMQRLMIGDWRQDLPPMLIVTVGYFCITSDFSWLLVVFEYFYFFLALGLLVCADLFLKNKMRLLTFIMLTLVCLILGDTIGMVAVFVCIAALLLNCCIDSSNVRKTAIYVIVIAIFFVLQYWLLGRGIGHDHQSRAEALAVILEHSSDMVISFFSIFSLPIVDINILKHETNEQNAPVLQFGLGVACFLAITSIYIAYFYYQGWRKSYLPLLCIAYGLLSWVLIYISRYTTYGVDVMDEPRYVRLFTLIYVGAGLALFCVRPSHLYRRVIGVIAAVAVFMYINAVDYRYWQDQFIETYNANLLEELKKDPVNTKAVSTYLWRCGDDYCQSSIDFMKQHKLGLFDE